MYSRISSGVRIMAIVYRQISGSSPTSLSLAWCSRVIGSSRTKFPSRTTGSSERLAATTSARHRRRGSRRSERDHRMLQVESCRLLIGAREHQQFGLLEKTTQESERHWSAVVAKTVRENDRRMSREVRGDELGKVRRARRCHDHIDRVHEIVPLLDRDGAE